MAESAVTTDYRLSPRLAARLMGLLLVSVGLMVCVATVVISLADLPMPALGAVAGLALVVVLVAGGWLTRRGYVVRCTPEGYRVRFVRGAGVARGRWADVVDAVTADVAGARCVVLRRRDGTTTTIPLEMLAGSPEAFVRDLRERLQRGHKLRRLR